MPPDAHVPELAEVLPGVFRETVASLTARGPVPLAAVEAAVARLKDAPAGTAARRDALLDAQEAMIRAMLPPAAVAALRDQAAALLDRLLAHDAGGLYAYHPTLFGPAVDAARSLVAALGRLADGPHAVLVEPMWP